MKKLVKKKTTMVKKEPKKNKGLYIVLEGGVGAGKTTQTKLLVDRLTKEFPRKKIVATREPGGSEIATAIRHVFQGQKFDEVMHPICEQYLVASARAQSLRVTVRPNLKKGAVVIADRSFFTSIANQGFGRKLGYKAVMKINDTAVDGTWPDKVILLDIKAKAGLKRVSDHGGDKFESLGSAFHNRVYKGYMFAARKFPKIVKKVDANRTIEEIHEDVYSLVLQLLKANDGKRKS